MLHIFGHSALISQVSYNAFAIQDKATDSREHATSLTQVEDEGSTKLDPKSGSSSEIAGDFSPHQHPDSEALALSGDHRMKEGKQTQLGQEKSSEGKDEPESVSAGK